MSVTTYQPQWCNIPEHFDLQQHYCENLTLAMNYAACYANLKISNATWFATNQQLLQAAKYQATWVLTC